MVDVMIVGAGLAGLQCARLLARSGVQVWIVDRRARVEQNIQTTGIFVRKTLEDFDLPESTLGPPIRDVLLYPPSKVNPLRLSSTHDEFRIGDVGALNRRFLAEAEEAGGRFLPATTFLSAEEDRDWLLVTLRTGSREWCARARFIVGADGARSTVARALGLDRNTSCIVGVENIYAKRASTVPALHCFVDPRIAPGYIGWIADDGNELHVGVGGHPARFNPRNALAELESSCGELLRDRGERRERRGGLIPVNGVLRRIGSRRGLLVGDAAGVVSPLTAGGLDGCLRLSRHAAKVLSAAVRRADSRLLDQYSGEPFRGRLTSRVVMRRLFDHLASRPLAELAVAAARMPLLQPIVRHVFFGRGSFPDVAPARGLTERLAE